MIKSNGILIIDKYKGFTSFDVIAKLRGILKMRKIGHAGTLDPMATGVLPVFIGSATRAINFLENHDKEYIASFVLGLVTDTQDVTGKELERNNKVDLGYGEVEEAIKSFVGEISQLPPMYSAVKIDGKRLYEYARQGKEVKREPRPVTFYSVELLGVNQSSNTYTIKVRCSKGAYIRTLCHDIGAKLGVGATLSKLNRIEACGYKKEESLTIDGIEEMVRSNNYSFLKPTDTAFKNFEKIELDQNKGRYFQNGVKLLLENIGEENSFLQDKIYTVYSEGRFLGLAHPDKNILRIDRIFT